MPYDPDIHHRRSIRLKGYNYSEAGAYFVTVCAHNRECLFGEIVDGEMRLSDAGRMVKQCWNDITIHFPYVGLDEFVVMPNHVHGIIVIVGAQFIEPINCDETNRNKEHGTIKQGAMNRAPTVGEIVRAFKARCTHAINQIHNTPGHPVWQRNYYEHIIRNEDEMNRIRQYIICNPAKWAEDLDNPANIGPGRGMACHAPTTVPTDTL